MTTETQQLPADPARRLADKILARTNNGQDLIVLLHDISRGGYDASKNDRITATNFLTDRGYGKCPKQAPASGDGGHTSDSVPAPVDDKPKTTTEPESPRLVTQVSDALHESLGPAPSAHTPDTHSHEIQDGGESTTSTRHSHESGNPESFDISDSPDTSAPFDPTSIQDFIIEITNDGETLVDTLMEIGYADADDPTVTSRHRSRAGRILVDRFMGTNPTALKNGVCPECRKKWAAHPGSPAHPESDRKGPPVRQVRYVDPVALAEARAEIQRMKDEGILTPDPTRPKIDISSYLPPDDFDLTPYAKEEAAAFLAEVNLRLERQKQWPEIEERRRKKLAQIYPSHSDDGPPNP